MHGHTCMKISEKLNVKAERDFVDQPAAVTIP